MKSKKKVAALIDFTWPVLLVNCEAIASKLINGRGLLSKENYGL